MRAICIVLIASALGACATTETPQVQPPAAVEDRTPGAKPGATAQPVPGQPITGVDLTGRPAAGGAAALKDPNNILSKRSVFYDFDKFDVKEEYRPMVEAHARYLRENGGTKMLVQGNADERGSREYNLALGQRRSEGVKRMLMLLGGREEQIEAVSLGEEKPRATGSGEEAWAQNRRSDMLYPGEY
jgi:peptidoglycan-associated lipoprotein